LAFAGGIAFNSSDGAIVSTKFSLAVR
jgi:hypothetical protein